MLLLAVTSCRDGSGSNDAQYAELDAAIARSPQYVAAREARLAKMRRTADTSKGEARERALLALYGEYSS